MFRALLGRLLAAVDSEKVRLFQSIVYAGVWVAGLYMVALGKAPSPIQQRLGDGTHYVWVYVLIIAPVLVTAGYFLVWHGERAALTATGGGGRQIDWGWSMQAGGDAAVTFGFLTYAVAVFQSAWLRNGIFSAFIVVSLALCAAILVFRDLRRLWILR